MQNKRDQVLDFFGANDVACFDAHMHLPWVKNPAQVKNKFFGQTVTPAEYEEFLAREPFQYCLGLGLHPWYIAESSIEDFERLASTTKLIGEIGLDFVHESYTWAKDNGFHVAESPRDLQIETFERVCKAIQPGSIVSVHAVGTKGKAHEILKNAGVIEHSIVIYHWFSDDGDTLHQAIKDGCLFSINSWMLDTKRGREYARQIPLNQKLWETDQPETKDASYNFDFPGSL